MENLQAIGTPSQLTCPDHTLEGSLRALKEREQLLRRMAAASRGLGDEAQAEIGLLQAAQVQRQAARLAELIAEGTGGA